MLNINIKTPVDITLLDRLGYIGDFGVGALGYKPFVSNMQSHIDDIVLDSLSTSSLEILQY